MGRWSPLNFQSLNRYDLAAVSSVSLKFRTDVTGDIDHVTTDTIQTFTVKGLMDKVTA